MAHTKKLIIPTLCLFLSSCLQTATIPVGNLETLYGFDVNSEEWIFTVLSTGCTETQDFKLHTHILNDKTLQLGLERVKPDLCKMAPHLISLKWTTSKENHQKEIALLNPVRNGSKFGPGILLEK